jgi:oxygen-dependent protoporphyrinogen oxidase
VVVAGGGISGLALGYLLRRAGIAETLVLEADDRAGGKVITERTDEGYLIEWGVNGFLDNKPRTLELAGMLGLAPLRSSENARKRFILAGGALHRLPESPGAFLKSDLLTWRGKLRIALEPFIPKRMTEDETLASFARRRLGREAFEMFIDPMASGVFAGDPEELSLKSCFPRIDEMEQTYGSLVRAMVRLMAERRKQVSAAPAGVLTSFGAGMRTLTDALAHALGGSLRTGSRVASIDRREKTWLVHIEGGETIEADAVVLAVPAYQCAAIVRGLAPTVARALEGISYPPLAVVNLGFRREDVAGQLDAFGFLVPGREREQVLGTLYDSSIFPGRAPEGHVQLRSMAGGARQPGIVGQDDAKVSGAVLGLLRRLLALKADPVFVRVHRHEKAIPQYALGHARRLRTVEDSLGPMRGLHVTGNAFRGVSLNDCVANAFTLAERIAEEMA